MFNQLSKKLTEFELTKAKYVDPRFSIGIKMRVTEFDKGLKLINDHYEWNLTKNKWSEFRERMIGLYRNGTNGHLYLDSESEKNDDLQVVLSLNEYNLNFWNKHRIEK